MGGSCLTAWEEGREVIGHAQVGNKRQERLNKKHMETLNISVYKDKEGTSQKGTLRKGEVKTGFVVTILRLIR